MARRNGYTDHAEPMAKLRKALAAAMRGDCAQMSREDLVKHGVEKLLNKSGLFAQYENEFKGYIVSNAISMAEGDVRAAGIDPVRGTSIQDAPPLKPRDPVAVRARADAIGKRDAEILAIIERRVLIRLAADCTMHEAWVKGGELRNLGKKNDKRLIWSVHGVTLKKLGIEKV